MNNGYSKFHIKIDGLILNNCENLIIGFILFVGIQTGSSAAAVIIAL